MQFGVFFIQSAPPHYRRDAANALSGKLRDELDRAIDNLEADKAKEAGQ
jgi:hypothetical protein